MIMNTIGCIGCGNMGGAILRGLQGKSLTLLGADHTEAKILACGATPSTVADMARTADCILVATKPVMAPAVLAELACHIPAGRQPVVVCVAAGLSIAALQKGVGGKTPVVRCMPNTPVAVGMGSFALSLDDPALTPEQKDAIIALFNSIGRSMPMAESRIAAFTALVGCGPAYIFYMLEALAEAGVTMGIPRKEAMDMAAYLCAGSARLAMEPGAHPSILREAVCSPAGSTIQGVMKLDEAAVKAAMIRAVHAAWEKEKSREV